MTEAFLTADVSLLWVTAIAALAAILTTSELLYNRRVFRDEGLLSWTYLSQRYSRSVLFAQLRWLLAYPRFVAFLVTRLVAALLLILALMPWLSWRSVATTCVVILFLSRLLVNFRLFSPEGSDSIDTLVWGGLLCAWIVPESTVVQKASLWFIALQSCCCYAANGWRRWAKDPPWRRENPLASILDHPLFGSPWLSAQASRHALTGKLLASSVVLVEIAFPLVLVAGFPLCWLFIAWGIAFHLFNSVVMGLSHFLLSFLATYPAILYCAATVASWI